MTTDNKILLGVLDAIERSERVTQRSIAQELGIALGLVNLYLKRCVRKGFVKVSEAPARRYAYYLTPHGFSEKTRLTGEYLYNSFHFFRVARRQFSDLLAECRQRGDKRIAVAGTADLAEIVVLCANEAGIPLAGVVGEGEEPFHGLPVYRLLSDMGPLDAVILTDYHDAEMSFRRLCDEITPSKVMAPEMLRGFIRQEMVR